MTSQPDPTDGPRRLLWEAIQLLRGAPSITARQDAAIRLVDRRIDEFEAALRVVPPEGGPRQPPSNARFEIPEQPAGGQPPSDGMPSDKGVRAFLAAVYNVGLTDDDINVDEVRIGLQAYFAAERGVSAVPPTEEPTDLASAVRSYFAGGPIPENIAEPLRVSPSQEAGTP